VAHDPQLSTRRWQAFRASIIRTSKPYCHICTEFIDVTLPGTHRDGPTVDHLIPRALGGAVWDKGNVALAHQHCNARKRDRNTNDPHSRNW
jgi:5-methylcytosine-specific restriction endonuclease McrA